MTIQASAIGKDRKIKTGDIQLLEPAGTPGGGLPSDLIRFLAGPPDKNGDASFYSLQFFSGKNEGFDEGGNIEKPVPGDVGFAPDSHAKQVNEVDLEFATANWRLAGTGNPDPNAKLNLKGKSGFAYIARCPDVSNPDLQNCDIGGILPFREGPIGYIFVSDTVSTPEPASVILLITGIGFAVYPARKRLT